MEPVVAVVPVDIWVVVCEELPLKTEIVWAEDISTVLPETPPVTVAVLKDVAVELCDGDKVVDASVSLAIPVTIKDLDIN